MAPQGYSAAPTRYEDLELGQDQDLPDPPRAHRIHPENSHVPQGWNMIKIHMVFVNMNIQSENSKSTIIFAGGIFRFHVRFRASTG